MAWHHGEEADRTVQQEEEEEGQERKEGLRQEKGKGKEKEVNSLYTFQLSKL